VKCGMPRFANLKKKEQNLIEFGAHMWHVHREGDATKVDQNMSHLDSKTLI
jgi:hypothetical protein